MKKITKLGLIFILLLVAAVSAYDGVMSMPDEFLKATEGTCGNGICEPRDCPEDCNDAKDMVLLDSEGNIKKSLEIGVEVSTFNINYFLIGGIAVFALAFGLGILFFIKKKEIKLLNPHKKFKVKMKRRKYKPKFSK